MATPKLDIFRVLNAANAKNVNFFRNLTEEEQKAFVPFLVARWMSGTNDARQVYFINELMNSFTFSLQQHKELLWYLLVICNSGKSQKYVWNKTATRGTMSMPVATKVVMDYFEYSTEDAKEALDILKPDDVYDMGVDLGLQADDLTKLKKELKITSTKTPVNATAEKSNNKLLEF